MSGPSHPSILRRLDWRAILIGLVVDFGATTGVGAIIGIVAVVIHMSHGGDPESAAAAITKSPFILNISLAIGMFFVVVGGFITGKIARRAWLLNSVALGILGILISLAFIQQVPLWYSLVSMAGTIPCALLGAWLSSVLFPTYEPVPPPLPPAS